jgi:hypothetical protein
MRYFSEALIWCTLFICLTVVCTARERIPPDMQLEIERLRLQAAQYNSEVTCTPLQ